MTKIINFIKDTRGDAIVVEAAIIFPIMCMVITALFLLAIYLPQRALLQEAAQVAAVAVATDKSDTWVSYDSQLNVLGYPNVSTHIMHKPERFRRNVYRAAFRGIKDMIGIDEVEAMVNHVVNQGFVKFPNSTIEVEQKIKNLLVYKHVTVTVTQTIPVPEGLAFIGFFKPLVFQEEAIAVVSNGDEFVRNIDIAKDVVTWIGKSLGEVLSFTNSSEFGNLRDDDN